MLLVPEQLLFGYTDEIVHSLTEIHMLRYG